MAVKDGSGTAEVQAERPLSGKSADGDSAGCTVAEDTGMVGLHIPAAVRALGANNDCQAPGSPESPDRTATCMSESTTCGTTLSITCVLGSGAAGI